MKSLRPAAIIALPLALSCTSAKEKARADSAQALATTQKVLIAKLDAHKYSLSQVVNAADNYIAKLASSVPKVKGPQKSKQKKNSESPSEEQLNARKEMLKPVSALVRGVHE